MLLLLATAADVRLTQELLGEAGILSTACPDVAILCRELARGAGAVLVAEERLAHGGIDALGEVLASQPAWSELPILLLASKASTVLPSGKLPNLLVLDRPVAMRTLRTAVETALHARRRQYQVRDYLDEQERVAAALRASEARLAADLDAMSRLQRLGTLFVQDGNLDKVLGAIVDAAIALSDADYGNIQLLAPDSGDLTIVASRNFPQWWLDYWNTVSSGQGVCGTALARGERVIVEDVEQSAIFLGSPALDIQRRAGVRAVQSTPLMGRSGRPLGMFSTHYKTPHRPDERSLRLLDLLARQAGDIIERAQGEEVLRQLNASLEHRVQERTADLQRLTGELAVAEQRQRQRLSAQLHDGLQQLLVGARMQVEMLSRIEPDRGRLTDHCNAVLALLTQAVNDSRSLSVELSPPILRQAGLLRALAWLARWMEDTHHLTVDLRTDGGGEPHDEGTRILLFQTVRELLLNTVKHAEVQQATVEVTHGDGHIQIMVADRGKGFDPTRIPRSGSGGLGLASVRERLHYLGGQLDIESAPGHGSRLTLRVPLMAAGSPDRLVPAPPPPAVSGPAPCATDLLRLLVVDDHVVIRQSLARVLAGEPDLEVVGEAADGKQAVELAGQLQPDVILMDVSMPVMDGIAATQAVRTAYPHVQVIGLSMFSDAEQAQRMREAGAADYVAKASSTEVLLAAIRGCAGRDRAD